MSGTVIDALFVTLGLDPKGFKKGADDAVKVQADLEKKVRISGKRIEDDRKRSEKEDQRRAKDSDKRAREAVNGLKAIRNEALTLLAVFTGGVGLVKFISNTVTSAASLGRLSQNLGVSTERLGAWQQAAERAGGSAEGAIAQLKESADAVASFKMGRDAAGMDEFWRQGGKPSDLKDGNTYLMARANIIKRLYDVDPTKAMVVAKLMNIGEDQFNLIKLGEEGMEKLLAERQKYSKFSAKDAADADELRKKMLDLRDSLEYTAAKIAVKLAPTLEFLAGLLERVASALAKWVGEHQDDIKNWLKMAVDGIKDLVATAKDFDWKGFADSVRSIGSTFLDAAKAIREAVDAWHEWRGRKEDRKNDKPTEGVTGWFGNLFRFGKADKLDENDVINGRAPISLSGRQKYITDRARKEGFTDAQAAGIVGSLTQENGALDPLLKNPKSGAIGIGQWLSKDRKGYFEKKFGHSLDRSTFEEQVEFMFWELKNNEKRAGDQLRGAKTSDEAAKIHATEYERPGANEANIPRRQGYARSILGAMTPSASSGSPLASSVSSETHIGKIEIYTQATDAVGITREIGPALSRFGYVPLANTGLS